MHKPLNLMTKATGGVYLTIPIADDYKVNINLNKDGSGTIEVWREHTNLTRTMFRLPSDETSIPCTTHNLWAVLDIVRNNYFLRERQREEISKCQVM